MKLINDDRNLYASDKENYLRSLEVAKNLPIINNEKMIFHCFWRVPGEFAVKQLAVLKSIIVSHSNELDNIEINLWSNVDLTTNPYFMEVSEFVNFRIWDLQSELNGTVLQGHPFLTMDYIGDSLCYLEGDLFRLLVLNKYGGFYIDMDVLVLRNMRPLNNYEFLYQWGASGFLEDEPDITMNGAVMRFNKGSSLSVEALIILGHTPPQKNTMFWGSGLYSKITSEDLMAFPGVWFNSEWGREDAMDWHMVNRGRVDMYDGAFAWHWHNKWDMVPEAGSKFQILEEQISSSFKELKVLQ